MVHSWRCREAVVDVAAGDKPMTAQWRRRTLAATGFSRERIASPMETGRRATSARTSNQHGRPISPRVGKIDRDTVTTLEQEVSAVPDRDGAGGCHGLQDRGNPWKQGIVTVSRFVRAGPPDEEA